MSKRPVVVLRPSYIGEYLITNEPVEPGIEKVPNEVPIHLFYCHTRGASCCAGRSCPWTRARRWARTRFLGTMLALFFLLLTAVLLDADCIQGGGYYYHGTTKCVEGAYCRYFSDCKHIFWMSV